MASISVIIPCYNSEAFLKRAVDSVLRQRYTVSEIILVNNNSTDGTEKILNQYKKEFPGVIKVLEEPRKGAPFARNCGLAAATGDWLQFLDADDELLPEKLQRQVDLIEKDTDIIAGSFYEYRESPNGLAKRIIPVVKGNPWRSLIKSELGKTSSMLWRRGALLAAGKWNESKSSSQEYDLLFRMLKNKASIQYSEVPDTIHHVLKNSISRSENDDRMIEVLNNYVDLRIMIRNYLASEGKLTRELRHAVITSIYFKLLIFRKRLPAYFEEKLKEIKLKVPVQYILKHKARKTKGRFSAFLKRIFYKAK